MIKPLHDYIADPKRAASLASLCSTKPIYLRHIALGHRRAGPVLARLIEQHTAGIVPRWITRPDLWDAPQKAA